MGHSDFQMQYFILSKQGQTPYGVYKQALRELYSRYKGLVELAFSISKKRYKLKTMKRKYDEGKIDKEYYFIRKREIELQIEELYRELNAVKVEFRYFFFTVKELDEKFGGIPDTEKRELEKEYWISKLKKRAMIELNTQGRLSPSTMDTIMSLPKNIIVKVLPGEDKRAIELKK